MSLARRMERELRKEAKTLRELGFETIAAEREKQANMWEGVADKLDAARDHSQGGEG